MFKKNKIVLSDETKEMMIKGAEQTLADAKKKASLISDLVAVADKHGKIDPETKGMVEKLGEAVKQFENVRDWLVQELGPLPLKKEAK